VDFFDKSLVLYSFYIILPVPLINYICFEGNTLNFD
jgi:hypothetical protein